MYINTKEIFYLLRLNLQTNNPHTLFTYQYVLSNVSHIRHTKVYSDFYNKYSVQKKNIYMQTLRGFRACISTKNNPIKAICTGLLGRITSGNRISLPTRLQLTTPPACKCNTRLQQYVNTTNLISTNQETTTLKSRLLKCFSLTDRISCYNCWFFNTVQ